MEKIFSCHVILAFLLGRVESEMVGTTTGLVNAPSTDALFQDFLVTVECHNEVGLLSASSHNFIKFLGLRNGPWEAIK